MKFETKNLVEMLTKYILFFKLQICSPFMASQGRKSVMSIGGGGGMNINLAVGHGTTKQFLVCVMETV